MADLEDEGRTVLKPSEDGLFDRSSIVDLLSTSLVENDTWTQLMEAIKDVFDANIEDPIDQIPKIRHISRDVDPKILEYTARLLGFDLTQDVLSLSLENLTKMVTQLPNYPDRNSTVYFKNFIEIILNSIVYVTYLWTKDYITFYPNPLGTTIKEGGDWFKTTHIEVDLSPFYLESIVLNSNQTLATRMQELFYVYAPATLTIKNFNFLVQYDVNDWEGDLDQNVAFGVGAGIDEGYVEYYID